MKKRVILGMSGGLDSSISALLLQEEGYDVIGITLKFSDASKCCSEIDVYDARQVAQKLGIEHYSVDVTRSFEKQVMQYFLDEYSKGRTPNPCAVCNRKIKFKTLLRKAKEFDSSFVATGHYARIENKNNSHFLTKGNDKKKDQSYFLGRLKKEWLPHITFPVGQYTKKEIKGISKKIHLPFFEKKESQEICFIEGNDYRTFLLSKLPELAQPGNIIDTKGNILGEHRGIFFYTIGQRKGINVNINKPLYVTHINSKENTITVGRKTDAYRSDFFAEDINFLATKESIPENISVKIRSQHRATKAKLTISESRGILQLFDPQLAITPGQLAVFYDRARVLGSGWISNKTSLLREF